MKKIFSILSISAVLIGCSAADFVKQPFPNLVSKVQISNEDVAYQSAVECITRQVRPAQAGQFFTYESEKYHKFISAFTFYGRHQGILRYSSNSKEVTVELTDVRWCNPNYSCYDADEFTQSMVELLKPHAQETLDDFVKCLEQSQH